MKSFLLFVALLFTGNIASFSQSLDLKELKQNHLLMHADGTIDSVSLDKYKGKLIILDFWNRYCVSCLLQMPKIHGLRQKYAGRIEIIPVTKDTYDQVKAVYDKQEGGKFEIKFPTIYADSTLSDKFGVRGYPTGVWLNEDGTYLASTYGTAINEDVIEAVLSENYSLLDRSATVKGEVMLGKLNSTALTGKRPLLNVKILPYDLTNSVKESETLKDTSLYIAEYKNRTVIDLIKLLLYDNNDPFTVLLYKDNLNKRMKFSDDFKKEYSALFKNEDALTYEERVSMHEKVRYSVEMVYAKNVDHVELRNMALNMFELTIGHNVKRFFEESDILVLKYKTPKKIEMDVIPLESQVSLRTVLDLVTFLSNKSEHFIVADTESLYNVEIGITLDKTKEVGELIKDLKKLGIILYREKRLVEKLNVM
ncbi:TlpA family protein disulfide reductase [Sphingobacterium faecale]|uniref:TlpA family protein disulfide reductase n=1 Tax=Sphingobacterium faecale TaxID=2803775 RepID=A0ABS1RA14_9SPHI|nr:TlpA disulfide reductase family protein [Sphingobacterium faecale]MBL1411561.1 TlpA family protein disulfide reductase [Sphingobacterium faecale]